MGRVPQQKTKSFNMQKRKLSGSDDQRPPAAPKESVNGRRLFRINADEPKPADAAVALDISPKERAIMENIVAALHDIDIKELPPTPRGDTIRGLLGALDYLISGKVEPREHHHVPFNIQLTREEAALGRAAVAEVWEISADVLVGLACLRARGYVNHNGGEVPALWSPGDFYHALEDARNALFRLEALNDKLYQLLCARRSAADEQ
jgi:hypothetical protein